MYIGNHNNRWVLFDDAYTGEFLVRDIEIYTDYGYIYYFEKTNV